MQFYNRHILKTSPRIPYYYQKLDGRFLRMTPQFDHHLGHHICEWGYDMHWYALIERAAPDILFAKGREIQISYALEECEKANVPAKLLQAETAVLESAEAKKADMPIYEEPVCRFATSGLDLPDACRWLPGGDNCRWDRQGGPGADAGALVIDNGAGGGEGTWVFKHLGPSHGANPIPPKSRFRITAQVQASEPAKLALSMTLFSYPGPAMIEHGNPITSICPTGSLPEAADGFVPLSWETDRFGAYCLNGSFSFTYSEIGRAHV